MEERKGDESLSAIAREDGGPAGMFHERYVNPYTDFGFKKLFGTEMNKDLLISFLNSLFKGRREEIADVQYLNGELLGDGYGDRRSVFDVYCLTSSGGRFIVEMQKAEQRFFKDRSIYYATAPIREQAPRGKWDYRLEDVTTVGILDFVFPKGEYPEDSLLHEIKLTDVDDGHVFYDKLTFLYLEMPKFNKREEELETMYDKWLFALKNLARLLDRPKALQERIFARLFDQAEIARYSLEERREYETSVREYRDYINTIDTAHDKGWREGHEKGMAEGLEKGRAEGIANERRESARKMKSLGADLAFISQVTGLTEEEVETL